MNRLPHLHGAQNEQEEDTPIVLPRLVFRAQNEADFALTVDGVDHESLRHTSRRFIVGRGELGSVIASLAEQAGTAMRVEIHDSDGTVHADIIEAPPGPDRTSRGTSGAGGWVGPEGFLPGEPVLIAVVVDTANADQDGRLHLPLPPPPPAVASLSGQYVLVGAISHAAATRTVMGEG